LQFIEFDAAYLQRLAAHDPATERHFVDYFGELIRLKLRSRLSSKEAVEDVRQETFARVFKMLHSEEGIRQPERLGPIVNSICNFVLKEHYRARSKKETTLDDEPESNLVSPGETQSGLFEIKHSEVIVRKVLVDMPERDRRLLEMVLLEERDKDEVCAEFGLTRDYLRVLVHRAKQSFKSHYLRHYSGGNS
jgi:RNA polymerase sigma-70 factor (ECF subfamily)